jgi:galactitol-specific phosphotransferase system IIB component
LKRILVAAGTSDNKRNFAVNYIKTYLGNKGVEAEVLGENIYEIKTEELDADLIVAIGPWNCQTSIPVIQGTVFVTRIGMDPVCDEIIRQLR